MSSIGKVHLNGSTVLSLNDRFTIMQKQGGGGGGAPRASMPPPRPRARSRSRSRSRYTPQITDVPISPRVSLRNRSLLQQLDQRHKLRVALKLKRKSMKIRPQNAIGVRGRRQLIRPSAAALVNTATNSRRRLRRSNSMAKQIATIKADLIKNVKRVRRLTQSNSTMNLSEQFGVRGRPRLRRNNQVAERAASRSRARSASRNRTNLTRTNSKQNLRGRSASRQRQQQGAPIRLKRSNSRLNLRGPGQVQQGPANVRRQQRSRSQSRSNVRRNATSVNARLGVRRQNAVGQGQRQQRQPNRQGIRKVQRGRIVKRPNINARIGNGVKQRQQQRQQQPQQQRGRSRSRVRNVGQSGGNQQRKGGNQQRQQQRGRSRQRGNQIRGQPQKKIGKREPPKSKEQLDAELDQYMVNTKSSLDQEMSIYTK